MKKKPKRPSQTFEARVARLRRKLGRLRREIRAQAQAQA